MGLTKGKLIEKYPKEVMHCLRNTSLPYEYEWTCLSCGYNVIEGIIQFTKIQRGKISFYQPTKIF